MEEKKDDLQPEGSKPEVSEKPARPFQSWLLPYENPLKRRFDKDFFKSIPMKPGVYTMLGDLDAILYVGKAKSLRTRLNCYKRAHPDKDSRKTIRMLNLVRKIQWEECESETAALLRENQLLRDLKPPFNVMNTTPESYYFIAVKFIEELGLARFRLTTQPKKQGDLIFGTFRARGSVRQGYLSLLRLIWAVSWVTQNEARNFVLGADDPLLRRFEFPSKLSSYKPPYLYSVEFPEEWTPLLKKYLNGVGDDLLVAITERLLLKDGIPRFYYGIIQEDLEIARRFFETCAQRNRNLRLNHGLKTRIIAQEKIDDLIVLERERVKRKADEAS